MTNNETTTAVFKPHDDCSHDVRALHPNTGECLMCRLEAAEQEVKNCHADIDQLRENDALHKDMAFYRCCALSGETPKEGSEPSAAKVISKPPNRRHTEDCGFYYEPPSPDVEGCTCGLQARLSRSKGNG